jgi:PAS domain-containing protein/ActR/RegA family two-component response regulator
LDFAVRGDSLISHEGFVQITSEEAEDPGSGLARAARLVCRALDQAPQGFVVARFDGECLAANATFGRWLELPLCAEDPGGLSLLVDADRCPEIMLALRAAARGEARVIESDRVPLLWSRRGQFRIHVMPFRVTGDVLAASLLIEDITEQARLGVAFEASEQRFQKLVECASDGIVVHRNQRVLYANPAALRLLGREHAEELVGLPVAALFDEASELGARDQCALIRRDGTRTPVSLRAARTAFDEALASFLLFRPLGAVADAALSPVVNATVLVCDDEERLATLTAALLEQQGYRALIASGAESAASVVDAQHLDVLVLDVNLACSSASAVLERVAERGFRGPTILTSGYSEEDVPSELLHHPRVSAYVAKPYSVEHLVAAIDRALERERAVC